jgi:hypothetical protein
VKTLTLLQACSLDATAADSEESEEDDGAAPQALANSRPKPDTMMRLFIE